ncbi:MAG: mechanosensitive ion channel family protein, partial [Candidatus Methylumidiphilus sp.]
YAAAVWSCHRYARHRRGADESRKVFRTVLPGVAILMLTPVTQHLLGEVIRLSPTLYGGITIALWVIFYLTLPWVIWIAGEIIAEWIIENERIQTGNIDAQLIRLGFRLVSIILAIGIIIEGANRVGLPSYSVIAGLGIGGLAMALAGQQALANLLGSLIIMLEKPFRVGHSIRTSGMEGQVEDIGFRSTRLRTPENTLVIVPSASLVNSTIENLTPRKSWRVKRTICLKFGTAMSDIRVFKSQVEALLLGDKDIKDESVKVALSDIGGNGFELTVDYTISIRDERERIQRMDQIMNAIGDMAESHSIKFGKSGE